MEREDGILFSSFSFLPFLNPALAAKFHCCNSEVPKAPRETSSLWIRTKEKEPLFCKEFGGTLHVFFSSLFSFCLFKLNCEHVQITETLREFHISGQRNNKPLRSAVHKENPKDERVGEVYP